MKIISKIYLAVAALAVAAVWGQAVQPVAQAAHLQPDPVQPGSVQPGPVQPGSVQPDPVQQAVVQAPLDKHKHVPVVAVRKKTEKPPIQQSQKPIAIKMVPVDKLLQASSVGNPARSGVAHNAPEKATQEEKDAVGLDIGKGLPLPMPESVLIAPIDKPDGFHVGVDYHLDQKWDLTGLAGVTTNGGTVISPAKPTFNQVGVRASYRF